VRHTIGVILVHVSLNSVLASRITFVKLVNTYPGLRARESAGRSKRRLDVTYEIQLTLMSLGAHSTASDLAI
jgi:hypothetical protein